MNQHPGRHQVTNEIPKKVEPTSPQSLHHSTVEWAVDATAPCSRRPGELATARHLTRPPVRGCMRLERDRADFAPCPPVTSPATDRMAPAAGPHPSGPYGVRRYELHAKVSQRSGTFPPASRNREPPNVQGRSTIGDRISKPVDNQWIRSAVWGFIFRGALLPCPTQVKFGRQWGELANVDHFGNVR
jgi:hypothetical protein